MNSESKIGCFLITCYIMLIIIVVALVSIWTNRTLDFWLTHFSHHTVNVPAWLSILVTIIGNGFMFAINVISEVARLCI